MQINNKGIINTFCLLTCSTLFVSGLIYFLRLYGTASDVDTGRRVYEFFGYIFKPETSLTLLLRTGVFMYLISFPIALVLFLTNKVKRVYLIRDFLIAWAILFFVFWLVN